ncbi:aldose epimerase family protein [Pseudooceanicola algae]|uniref:Aldose 1-epimerase n=1 Tax=Pseudooceanicola algae TaxID=1537215 RepID=A0A418SLC9_9RHOB|nr:aldose epimerase family protein [Pseudooceanicola algae]QPM90854.1 Aldose 1-epimerase [Pseudooceanicola algae]
MTTFGTLPGGEAVRTVTIAGDGLRADLMTFGASLIDLRLDGVPHPLVLGSPRLQDYLGPLRYFGATVGRYANRIAGGCFSIDGTTWQLDRNEAGRTTLHGGSRGMGGANWHLTEARADMARFALTQPDGHMGFPGALEASCTYRIANAVLEITMEATCTAACPISLANHAYFNLDGSADARDHTLKIAAQRYTPVDAQQIPTGDLIPVAGTPFDFRAERPIGTAGYDHNFCLDGSGLRPVATLRGRNGVFMQLETDAPGLQVYDLAHLSAGTQGHTGMTYGPHAGIAMETQEWPDAMNQPAFPDPVKPAGAAYCNTTRLSFFAE